MYTCQVFYALGVLRPVTVATVNIPDQTVRARHDKLLAIGTLQVSLAVVVVGEITIFFAYESFFGHTY
jgi:hypothetical protein